MDHQQLIYDCAESFYESTQIPLSVLSRDGLPLYSFGGPCAYCTQFKNLTGNEEICERRHLLGCRVAVELKKGYVFSCQGGLILFAVGLMQKGVHVCSMIAGPVLPEIPNIEMIDEILHRMSLPLGGRRALYSALTGMYPMEPRRIEYLCRLLDNSTRHLLDTAFSLILESREKAEEDRRLHAYLNAIQSEPELKDDNDRVQELEDKLVHAIRNRNAQDAKSFIEQIFTAQSICSGMQTTLTTIHAIELLTLLARTTINSGAGVYAMYQLTNQAFYQLMEARTISQISYLLGRSVEDAISLLDVIEIDETTAFIRQSMYYIHQHYTENITLDDVSENVHLSPSYFSSLFKEKTGVAFTAYVNQMKTERAKKLLKKTEMTLVEIAMSLGFCSQSYFSTVFKKHVGVSPNQYRHDSSGNSFTRI